MKGKVVLAAALGALVVSLCAGCGSSVPGLGDLEDLANMAEDLQDEIQNEIEQERAKAEFYASSESVSSQGTSGWTYEIPSSSNIDSSDTSSQSSSPSVSSQSGSISSSSSDGSVKSGNTSSKSSSSQSESASSKTSQSSKYILPNSDSEYISESKLRSMTDYELMIARNEIYARHGRKFKDAQIRAYFEKQSWYKGTIDPDDFNASVFNAYERANLDAIIKVEKSR